MELMSSLILVTGSTGYIASRLIPQLLERGYRVRALARHPQRLKARKWFSQVDFEGGRIGRGCRTGCPTRAPTTQDEATHQPDDSGFHPVTIHERVAAQEW